MGKIGNKIKNSVFGLFATKESNRLDAFSLKRDWLTVSSSKIIFDLLKPRWKYNWSCSPINATSMYSAIRLLKPKVLVETGTFEGCGTYAMARAAHENCNGALIITIDYDDDPTTKLPQEDWLELSKIREENLDIIRQKFTNCEVRFFNGDSRKILKSIFPDVIDYWDFFYQDSMHYTQGILAEWNIMRKFSLLGALAIFDDISLQRKIPIWLNRGFVGWFIRHEVMRGWDYVYTGVGHGQLWVQRVR